jgi:Salmonella virulence plasmid 65kDa B protein
MFGLRRDLGRLAGIDTMLTELVAASPDVPARLAARAVADIELARPEPARSIVDSFAADGFAGPPRDWLWLSAIGHLADCCIDLALLCAGSAARQLGGLAAAVGRYDEAAHHFEAAITPVANATEPYRPFQAPFSITSAVAATVAHPATEGGGMSAGGTADTAAGSAISLPKGGGAVRGLGETFAPDLFTGTGNFTVPIVVPAGRRGVQPSLSLAYSTGNGNGPFGLGWRLSLPGVSRKTSRGVPRYVDAPGAGARQADVFVLSGAEDLVPVAGSDPGRVRYRPRTEGRSPASST